MKSPVRLQSFGSLPPLSSLEAQLAIVAIMDYVTYYVSSWSVVTPAVC